MSNQSGYHILRRDSAGNSLSFLHKIEHEVMIVTFRLRNLFIFSSLVVLAAGTVLGEGTRTWEQSKFDELSKGTAKGVAILSKGGLELAPSFKSLTTTAATYLWDIASDNAGNLFAAAGTPARIYRITPDGNSTPIFQPQELQVQALVVDKSGVIFAATNPDGKVYRLEHVNSAAKPSSKASDGSWSSSVYFDPGTKYIWDLAQDSNGNLFVATGDRGEIFRVTPKGEHSLFFKSDEAHIRALDFDPKGNLIAGSDGSGLVYRISPEGEGFVLYSAPKKEITALAIDKQGNIYAAGAGEKRSGSAPIPTFTAPAPAPSNAPAAGSGTITVTNNPPQPSTTIPTLSSAPAGGSEIYRISPDGSPTRLWTSRDDLVYALGFDQQGRLLAGTGNRGHVFAIHDEDAFTDLVKASASQVTAFAKAPQGGLYVATSNLGKVFLLGASPASDGSYESDIFDAHIFSLWGRAQFRGAGNVELSARSGNVDNPDRNWSPWRKIDMQKAGEVSVPPARFIQWKAELRAGEPPPRIDSVLLNYLPKNVAPDFDDVNVQVGVRYQGLPKIEPPPGQPHFEQPPNVIRDPDSIGVRWAVHDDNDDQMEYSVYFRGEGENRWLLLKDQLTDKFYSFDASLLPDGGYTVKVVASDAPSHSPDQVLSAERESSRFEVDTTPPQIEALTAAVDNTQIHVTFRALDNFSNIKRAEYSVDAGDWQFVEPVGQLSDAKIESYDFRSALPAPQAKSQTPGQSDHVVVVRVYDRYDNMNSAKTVIRGK